MYRINMLVEHPRVRRGTTMVQLQPSFPPIHWVWILPLWMAVMGLGLYAMTR